MTTIEPTRIILVSGHLFGVRAFEGVLSSREYLQGQIDVRLMIGLAEQYKRATVGYSSLEGLAREYDTLYVSTDDGSLATIIDQIRELEPHYILVIGWSRLVNSDVLAIPRNWESNPPSGSDSVGCIGMHPTELPVGRGQAPIPWTIIKGLESTALSVFFLEEGADTGPIIAQYAVPVHPRETAASLFYRMANMHYTAGFELAGGLALRSLDSRTQDSERATRWPKRRPSDGEIADTMTFSEIDALVRALTGPYPRAFVTVDGVRYEIDSVKRRSRHATSLGSSGSKVFVDRIAYSCMDGLVDLFYRRHSR